MRPAELIYTREHPLAAAMLAGDEPEYAWGYEMGRADVAAGFAEWDAIPPGYREGYRDGYADWT